MKALSRFAVSLFLIVTLLSNVLPCGPGYITPLFDTTSAPESPYSDYAAGRLGIIKPKFRRTILYAAYRYIAGNGLSTPEQQAMIEVWKAEINNKSFTDNGVDEAVRTWVEKRKDVVGKEENTPDIYVERTYGGYDFFPNCTKNAFETAAETLADRATSHGASDKNVGDWVKAQDQVFQNCSSGKQRPEDAPVGSPEWLQKDRSYQLAAASFYSLDFAYAKRRFAEIAQDADSPWQETADYLVARTLIRQASLSKDDKKSAAFYAEAEAHLQKFISRTGKFAASAERLTGLIKYRLHPKARVSELAKKLSLNGADENFRQDVIDYNWLLDKFESETLNEEEKRKEAEKPKPTNSAENAMANAANSLSNFTSSNSNMMMANRSDAGSNASGATYGVKKDDGDIAIYLTSEDLKQHWTLYVDRNATDEEALAEADKLVGGPLTEEMKKRVREYRRSGYAEQFTTNQQSGYQREYYGDEKLTPSLMPDFLKQDHLTDWLFTFQTPGTEAYLYSLKQFREGGSNLWLMTALTQADKSSTELPRLLQAAMNASRSSPAYPTIAYHHARILLMQGKSVEARKLLDEMIASGDVLPISARNSFIGLRLNLAETLEDYLKYSLKQPYAFDFDGHAGSVDEIVAEQKAYFDPEHNKEGRGAYDAEIEVRYQAERLWQGRSMFDLATVDVFNQHFSTASLLEVMRSAALPDYMRERFAVAIWTRAFLLKITPELSKYRPEFEPFLTKVTAAKTPAARENALMFFVLKNPLLSPFVEDGMGKTDNESGQFESNDWWCEPYDSQYSDETEGEVAKSLPPRPTFLTSAQSQAAQNERKRLKEIGDAPKHLAAKVLTWAKRYPADRRIPEGLYIMIEANGWTKYGCGNNEEMREEMVVYLRKHYPNSEWTAKLNSDGAEK
jgi:hypothetical protein